MGPRAAKIQPRTGFQSKLRLIGQEPPRQQTRRSIGLIRHFHRLRFRLFFTTREESPPSFVLRFRRRLVCPPSGRARTPRRRALIRQRPLRRRTTTRLQADRLNRTRREGLGIVRRGSVCPPDDVLFANRPAKENSHELHLASRFRGDFPLDHARRLGGPRPVLAPACGITPRNTAGQ